MNPPPVWSRDRLEAERLLAEEHFRLGRHTEPLELYLVLFDEYQGVVEEVVEQTLDLSDLKAHIPDIVADARKFEVLRYLSGPPVSLDDLKVLLRARSFSKDQIESDPDILNRLVNFIQDWHDRRRFPWVHEAWEPTENDRKSAILATSSLLAMRRLETMRRNQGKKLQEELVATQLRRSFDQVNPRTVSTLTQAPHAGEFCRESKFGTRKADFIIGLPDGRTMALECKVSNSATNSIKRLNNDAAVKAVTWREEFGTIQVATAAVLGGVYALRNLIDAQSKGLTLFWSHDLVSMINWMYTN